MSLVRALRDLVTIKRLLTTAEAEAHRAGHDQPGPEHLLLAALALPDGTAARVFRRFGLDETTVRTAIADAAAADRAATGASHTPAGAVPPAAADLPANSRPGTRPKLYRSTPEAQAVFRSAVELTKQTKPRSRLLGAHVVAAASDRRNGVITRALQHLAIDPATLRTIAREEARART